MVLKGFGCVHECVELEGHIRCTSHVLIVRWTQLPMTGTAEHWVFAARPIYRVKTAEGFVAFCCTDCMQKFSRSPGTFKVTKKEVAK